MFRPDVVKRKGHKVTWANTDKAFLFRDDSGKESWLPKRFASFTPDGGAHLKGDVSGEVIMPSWLAKKIKV